MILNSNYDGKLNITISGGSHEKFMTLFLGNLPRGFKISASKILDLLDERKPQDFLGGTPRKETDTPYFRKVNSANYATFTNLNCEDDFTLLDDKKCFIKLEDFITDNNSTYEFRIYNKNYRKSDYNLKTPRPSHVDFPAFIKYGNKVNLSGGGIFSGRMTAMLCIIGSICMQILEAKNITIDCAIQNIGGVNNDSLKFDFTNPQPLGFSEKMIKKIADASANCNSVGGSIYVYATGIPLGLGGPLFQNAKAKIANLLFSIPAIKSVGFGNGIKAASLTGIENNDQYELSEDSKIITKTNNQGGIIGGLTNGMPLICDIAIKPTASIKLSQQSINLETMEPVSLSINGRHDACIVPRIIPVCKSALAIAIVELLYETEFNAKTSTKINTDINKCADNNTTKKITRNLNTNNFKSDLNTLRAEIDSINKDIIELLYKRNLISSQIGKLKSLNNTPVLDHTREKEILDAIPEEMHGIFKEIFELSKKIQN
ncbi:MAG: chorismate synthase [Eubacteriales bacterium]|nr:chorismate synthase [Eubacteriales bacterium]MDY3332480.1 chorismate synthase [Gallibacter sp.]